MNQDSLIMMLWVAVGALAALAVTLYFTAEEHFKRAVKARQHAEQYAANASAQARRAALYKKAEQQATNRANLLAAHVTELEENNAYLERRVLYLSDLMRYTDIAALNRMAVMDAPLKWLPTDARDEMYTINLN